MARRRGRRKKNIKKSQKKHQRYFSKIAKREPLLMDSVPYKKRPGLYHEDYRLWHPDQVPFRDDPVNIPVSPPPPPVRGGTVSRDVKRESKRMVRRKVCRQRKDRRESLFRFNKIGKGKGGPKRKKITWKSKVRC